MEYIFVTYIFAEEQRYVKHLEIYYSSRPGVEFIAAWNVTNLETVALHTNLKLQMTSDKAIVS